MVTKQLLSNIVVISTILMVGCSSGPAVAVDQEQVVMDLNVSEFYKKLSEKGIVILDVRTVEEVSQGHIPGSVNFDFYADDFLSRVEKLDRRVPVMIYCAAGGRSGKARDKMAALGFNEIYNLEGGFMAWVEAGYPVSAE